MGSKARPGASIAEADRLLSAAQVGEWLGYSADSVYRLVRAEGLPCVRLAGRTLKFRRADVRGWLDARAVILAPPADGPPALPAPRRRPGRPATASGDWAARLKAAAEGPADQSR